MNSAIPRLSCTLQVNCRRQDDLYPALLRNIGPEGLRLELGSRIKKSDQVLLELPGDKSAGIPCLVQWCRKLPKQDRLHASLKLLGTADDLRNSWLATVLHVFGLLEAWQSGVVLLDTMDSQVFQPEGVPIEAPPLEPEPEPPPPPLPPEPVFFVSSIAPEAILEAPPPPLIEPVEWQPEPEWLVVLKEARSRVCHSMPLLNRVLNGLRSFAVEDDVSVVERRRVGRLRCDYKVSCKAERETFSATVVDVSPGGVSLQLPRLVRRGLIVELAPPKLPMLESRGPVRARVRYCKRLGSVVRAGLIVEEAGFYDSWLVPALSQLGFAPGNIDHKRKFVRARGHLPAEIRNWKGNFVHGAILDLSRGGAMVHSPSPWKVQDQLRLVVGPVGRLPLMYLSGVVVHQEENPAQAGWWLARLRFVELNAVQMKQLDQYILNLLMSVGDG